eukprot:CAMPEP_0178445652 /NCGR_PEP_ID=MMETSP0689_2-20121128/40305_1 /TAXON_ID=160604 /ORGANISM="Amphidinium massartii, Strain CS-259" /LENGTH=323 /DNA_ID=CAMNT_0020070265 /DNA_START=233 /DNA_END=1200 /DNA_ORIENTATION=+
MSLACSPLPANAIDATPEIKRFVQANAQLDDWLDLQWERMSETVRQRAPDSPARIEAKKGAERVSEALAEEVGQKVLAAASKAVKDVKGPRNPEIVIGVATFKQENDFPFLKRRVEEVRQGDSAVAAVFGTDEMRYAVSSLVAQGENSPAVSCYYRWLAINEAVPTGFERFQFAAVLGKELLRGLEESPGSSAALWTGPSVRQGEQRNSKAFREGLEALLSDLRSAGFLTSWSLTWDDTQAEIWDEGAMIGFPFTLLVYGDPLITAQVLLSEKGQGSNCDAVVQVLLSWMRRECRLKAEIDTYYTDVRYSPDADTFVPDVLQL